MQFRIPSSLSGITMKAVFVAQDTGKWWNGTALETFAAGNIATYAVAVTEQSTTKIYEGTVPAALPPGRYDVFGYRLLGATLAVTDPLAGTATVQYGGAAAVAVGDPLDTMNGGDFYDYCLPALVRDDMETEFFQCLTDAVMELDTLHEFDERQISMGFTDVISVAGDYRMNVEADMGILLGVKIVDGNFSRPLTKISKREFDRRYPNPTSDTAEGRPADFCLFGGVIHVGPRPDSTDYTYVKDYSQRLVTTLDSDTEIPFSAKYREVLKDGTLWRLFEMLKNGAEADRYAAKYQGGLNRIIGHDKRNQEASGATEFHPC